MKIYAQRIIQDNKSPYNLFSTVARGIKETVLKKALHVMARKEAATPNGSSGTRTISIHRIIRISRTGSTRGVKSGPKIEKLPKYAIQKGSTPRKAPTEITTVRNKGNNFFFLRPAVALTENSIIKADE
jgi:hypothetical protein